MTECDNRHCENGYIFDTLHACPECKTGRKIQHGYNVDELKVNLSRNKKLRQAIKNFEGN